MLVLLASMPVGRAVAAVDGPVVTVPWGASLEEVKRGLAAVAGLMERMWAPA